MSIADDRHDVRLCSDFINRVDHEINASIEAGKAAFDAIDMVAVENHQADIGHLLALRQWLRSYCGEQRQAAEAPSGSQAELEPQAEANLQAEPEPHAEPVRTAEPDAQAELQPPVACEPEPEPEQPVETEAPQAEPKPVPEPVANAQRETEPAKPAEARHTVPAKKNLAPEPLDNKTIGEARQQFLERCQDMDALRPTNKAEVAELQAVICLGRCALAGEKSPEAARAISDEMDRICGKWNEWELGEFFAYSGQRGHSPRTWRDLAEAYVLLAHAQACADLLESEPPADEAARDNLLVRAGAVQALLYLRLQALIPPAIDAANMELYRRLSTLAKAWGVYVEWWAPEASIDEVADEAAMLPSSLVKLHAHTRRDMAIAAVNNALARISKGDDPEKAINEAVTAALGCGIPPSNKDLRALLAGYGDLIHRNASKHHAKLWDYIHKDRMLRLAQGKNAPLPNDPPEDQEHLDRLQKLKELMQGKTMVWLGGNKGQAKRKDEIKKLLGLKEFLWPDMEEDTNPDRMASEIAKGDFVCLVVRFSRHSYKEALDDAKAQGKRVASLPAGLGVTRVVLDMYNQWLNGNGHAEA